MRSTPWCGIAAEPLRKHVDQKLQGMRLMLPRQVQGMDVKWHPRSAPHVAIKAALTRWRIATRL